METLGTHILAEYSGCDSEVLDNADRLEGLLQMAAQAAGATIVGYRSHRLRPRGMACMAVLQESHMSIRSWPDSGHASADFFTCGDCDPRQAIQVIADGLHAQSSETVQIERGRPSMPMMRVLGHRPTRRIEFDCTQSQIPASVCVRQSEERGLGLFSSNAVKCGELIYETPVWLDSFDTEYVINTDAGSTTISADDLGTELTIPVLQEIPENVREELANHYGLSDPSLIELRDNITEGGTREVLITDFDGLMNHSKIANIDVVWPDNCLSFRDNRPVWTIQIIASRDIDAGEELLWDYTDAPGVFVPSSWQS